MSVRFPVEEPFALEWSEYDEFVADVDLAGLTMRELAEQLGRNVGNFYAWRQRGRVPRYVKAYLARCLELRTMQRNASEIQPGGE
jgi:hypothetical protein